MATGGERITNPIKSIALKLLLPHGDNPNRMSRANFTKLVRNIERTGRYEPLIVRAHPKERGFFQIINGHHRRQALAKLGYDSAEVIVWDVDDEQTDILLVTLNRLAGSDELSRQIALLKRLKGRMEAGELSKLLPQTAVQLKRLTEFKMPSMAARVEAGTFFTPLVFFVNDVQQQVIEDALGLVEGGEEKLSKAGRRAAALEKMARYFLENAAAIRRF
jgi:hypothetical protein